MKPIVKRGREQLVIMEVVNENGETVGEYRDNGRDRPFQHHFVIERAQL